MKKSKTKPIADNIRRATNHACFATFYGRDSWKIVDETETTRTVELIGDSAEMLKGLIESKSKFDSLGVVIIGKKTETGLIVKVSPKPKVAAK